MNFGWDRGDRSPTTSVFTKKRKEKTKKMERDYLRRQRGPRKPTLDLAPSTSPVCGDILRWKSPVRSISTTKSMLAKGQSFHPICLDGRRQQYPTCTRVSLSSDGFLGSFLQNPAIVPSARRLCRCFDINTAFFFHSTKSFPRDIKVWYVEWASGLSF